MLAEALKTEKSKRFIALGIGSGKNSIEQIISEEFLEMDFDNSSTSEIVDIAYDIAYEKVKDEKRKGPWPAALNCNTGVYT